MNDVQFDIKPTRGHIVVIDDEVAIRELLEIILGDEGYRITSFDEFYGIESLLKAQPDLIILDVRLPKISGIELSQMLKGHPESKEIPLLGLSALSEKQMDGLQCDAFVAKPFDVDELVRQVDGLLKSKCNTSIAAFAS